MSLSLPGYQLMSPMAKTPECWFEFLGIHLDQVFVEIETPVGNGSEFHCQSEKRQQTGAGNLFFLTIGIFQRY